MSHTHSDSLQPQQQGFLARSDGARIFYQHYGSGDALLLIHAGVADSRMWAAQVAEFAAGYQVITFDLRGFGRSEMSAASYSHSDDIVALLDEVAVDAAHLVGISYGGLIALEFALEYPQRTRRLVLGAPSISGDRPSATLLEFWAQEEALCNAGDLEGAVELNLRLWVDGPHRRPHEVDAAMRSLVGAMQLCAFENESEDDGSPIFHPTPAMHRIHQLTAPTLLLIGELDLPEKLQLAAHLERQIADATTTILPGVAHMLNMERPAQFNAAVLNFLADN